MSTPDDDLEALRAALSEERERLRRALQERDDVLAVVSHDLRNPLNTISMAAEHLELDGADERDRRHCAAAIRRAVQRATHLIQDLLDISRIDQGGLSLDRRAEDPVEIASVAIEDHRLAAERKGIVLELSCPAPVEKVLADRRRLHQVLDNLLGNAIRHTPAGGLVCVHVTPEGAWARFSVIDDGEGIPEDELPRLFDRFYQVRRSDKGGAGLGLAIARGVVEGHGGTIEARRREQGGTVFTFTAPLASRASATVSAE